MPKQTDSTKDHDKARDGSGRTDSAPAPRQSWAPATRLVRGGTRRSQFGETSEALFMTSGFAYDSPEQAEARFLGEDDGFIYSRFSNPTVAMFEERMAQLEGAEAARATASGMAAIHAALLCQLKAGDHVVAARALFGSSRYILNEILPRFGVETTLIDGCDLDQWRAAIRENTVCALIETPSNPMLDILDIAAIADLLHAAGARLIVDNVFATPLLQRPLALGADIVVYSATKHIDGQGRSLGGVVLCDRQFHDDCLNAWLRHTGPSISPFNAWLMLKGLETLAIRVRAHCDHAARLASFLEDRDEVAQLRYPGLPGHPGHELAMRQMNGCGGPMLAFSLKGGKEAAFRFLNALETIDISNNLGDAKTLITHPATTTHQSLGAQERAALGIGDGLLRLSVGLEDPADIEADLIRGLQAM